MKNDDLQNMQKMDDDHVHCECGKITGEWCPWHGDPGETVTVEYMPEWLRGSHEAAGGYGGTWPHNGSERLTVQHECATRLADDEWCTIIDE